MSKSNIFNLDFRRLGGRSPGSGSVLGLAWDAGRLDGVLVRRTNGSVKVVQAFNEAMGLDLLTGEPELVGRELRNLLDAQGVRERRCVVACPLKWALTIHVQVPDLPEADLESFLQIEAERGFPCDVSSLVTVTSRYVSPSGQKHATIIGIPRAHLASLENVLRAAQLKPASFSLGLPALRLAAREPKAGVLALSIGENSVGLQAVQDGGIVALRAIEGAVESEGGHRRLRPDMVARETRITLAQLPPDLRDTVRQVRIYGPPDLSQQLADEIELRLDSLSLRVERVTAHEPGDFSIQVPPDAPLNSAFGLAVRFLEGRSSSFEFLPPRVSNWQQFASKYSSGRLQQAGLAAGVVALLVAGLFLYQEWQLRSLQRQWVQIRPPVEELRELQRRTALFRPWFDESFRGLSIMRRLTEAFPEDGSVTAKILEIRGPGSVTCTGTARDYEALLKTVERLRAAPEIPSVNLGQTRGNSPALQFTFSFVWSEGGVHAN